ncbi:MAG: hypothetical protein GKR94_22765 [Gammaproteobacteria bacterium]|nr:hypothetical protein [Gammaproteobacteria bacterium]
MIPTETVAMAQLEYVALVVDDPERSAAVFEKDLALSALRLTCGRSLVPLIPVGRSALALFALGDPFLGEGARKGVDHIAIAAAEPEVFARQCGLATVGQVSDGLDGNKQIALCAEATCGVKTRLSQPLSIRSASGHSALVERIDHIGVASADNMKAREVFIDKLGCVYESQQTDSEVEVIAEHFTSDKYPPVYHIRPPMLVGSLRVTFITVGDCELEFLQDLTEQNEVDEASHNVAGTTRGDRSTIARYVASRGGGLHHIALKTPDIDQVLTAMASAGHRVIDAKSRPGSRRAQIGFLHPSALGGVLLHFVEREER